MKHAKLIVLALVAAGTSLSAQEISETLAKPPRAVLHSAKAPIELEFCVADAITQIGGAVPVPVHDGPDKTLMLGYGHTPKIVVTLIKAADDTKIEVRTRSGDMDDKLVRHIGELCKLS